MSVSFRAEDRVISCRQLGKAYEIYDHPRQRMLDMLRRPAQRQGRKFQALSGLDFSVYRGESLGVIGRNGAGKSTLLQLLCGTMTPSTGSVSVNGRVAALLELGAGFNPEFSGLDNVYLNATILGLSRRQINERLDAILAFADIGDFVHQPVKHYSSGMFLRLAFAVIAHVDADVLIIDEALAVGDAVFAQKCMRFLREFRERGVLLLVSHDLPSVSALCDKVLWLDHGRQQMLGPAREVTEAYLEAIYAEKQTVSSAQQAGPAAAEAAPETAPRSFSQDMRRDLLLNSTLRNDIEVMPFVAEGRSFGTAQARLTTVALHDGQERPLAWLVGGEEVSLHIGFEVLAALDDVIVGFMFKDRLGQVLFGDNTFLSCRGEVASFVAGARGEAVFRFRLPYLPSGDYALTAALASGTQEDHVQHHWMHEALVLHCVASHVTHGLLGVPMTEVALLRGETEPC